MWLRGQRLAASTREVRSSTVEPDGGPGPRVCRCFDGWWVTRLENDQRTELRIDLSARIEPSALTVIRSAGVFWDELEETGIPGISEVNAFMADSYLRAISIDQQYAGHSTQVGMQAVSLPAGAYHGRFTVIVDDDIDVFDWSQVKWAMTSRCDPAEDIHIVEDCWSTTLDPRIPPDRKAEGDLTNSRAIIDATRPYHWRDEFPEDTLLSQELEDTVLEKYGDELFDSTE